MKAWIVYPIHDNWQALTFAETRSKARWLTARHYGCSTYDEAACFRARRCPSMDARADSPRVVEDDDAMLIESGQFKLCPDCGGLMDGNGNSCFACWRKREETTKDANT